MLAADIIIKPVYTEKAMSAKDRNVLVFIVHRKATKKQITNACTSLFNMSVVKVNVENVKGKVKRFRGIFGTRSSVKKAYVRVLSVSGLNL